MSHLQRKLEATALENGQALRQSDLPKRVSMPFIYSPVSMENLFAQT